MEINIREWILHDLPVIQESWLDFCRKAIRPDMRLKQDCEKVMTKWLNLKFRDPDTVGLIAECVGKNAGFLIARVSDWQASPPILEPRRIGIIDALYVDEQLRRKAIGTRLIKHVLQLMRDRNAVAAETIYEASETGPIETWLHAGFDPWMVHAYKVL